MCTRWNLRLSQSLRTPMRLRQDETRDGSNGQLTTDGTRTMLHVLLSHVSASRPASLGVQQYKQYVESRGSRHVGKQGRGMLAAIARWPHRRHRREEEGLSELYPRFALTGLSRPSLHHSGETGETEGCLFSSPSVLWGCLAITKPDLRIWRPPLGIDETTSSSLVA